MKTQKHITKLSFFLFLFIIIFFHNIIEADGLIVISKPHPGGNHFPLEVVYHNVNVAIEGQIATTYINQAFFNPTHSRLEGYYLFPVPKGAVIKEFKMVIDGKEVSAELLDAVKARKIYEDIVRQMKDPALLEYSEQDLFKVRIFPIEPRSEKKVSITYSEVITNDSGMYEYIYPLNTEKFSAKPLNNVSIKVDLQNNDELKTIYCPTHQTEIVRPGKYSAVVSYEEENVKPGIDFKLYFNTNSSKIGLSFLPYKKTNEDGYFFLSLSPAWEYDYNEIIEKDITFVLDVSGSMAGEKLKYAKSAIKYCIDNLNPEDRFEVIKFSTEAYGIFHDFVYADKKNKEKAFEFISSIKPVGGTNIEEAIQLALQSKTELDRPHMIIFITDGKPTIGETDEGSLVERIKSYDVKATHIFTFGIGEEIITHLLDKITQLTNATRTYISPSEDIEIKISQFYDKVESPVFTDLQIDFEDVEVYQMYPKNLPDLFKGSNLILFGRYKGYGKSNIVLTGTANRKKISFEFRKDFSLDDNQYDFIPSLWAARRIGHLLDLVRLHGESDEMIDEITQLARAHGIITPYTSYLILEDEQVRFTRNELDERFQTLRGLHDNVEGITPRLESEFKNILERSGAGSIKASEEVRDLNMANNLRETQQGKKRMNFADKDNHEINLLRQVRNFQGRAFYQNGIFWVDSKLQDAVPEEIIRLKFGSDEYFHLMSNNVKIQQFLALGRNVRFQIEGTSYEIYE